MNISKISNAQFNTAEKAKLQALCQSTTQETACKAKENKNTITTFRGAKVSQSLAKAYFIPSFAGSKIYKPMHTDEVFEHEANFSNGTLWGETVNFMNAKFHKLADFTDSKLSGNSISFINADFKGIADFEDAKFDSQYIGFNQAKFNQLARFSHGAMKANNISFSDIQAREKFIFSDMYVDANSIIFSNAKFERAKFSDTHFQAKTIDFKNTKFHDKTDFSYSKFDGYADFTGATFEMNDLKFEGASFQKGASFLNIPPGRLHGLLSGATYKAGTEELFILPKGMLFEDLGISPEVNKNPTLENLGIKNTPISLEELGIADKDAPVDYEKLGIAPPKEEKDPQVEMDELLDKLATLKDGSEKDQVIKRLSELM